MEVSIDIAVLAERDVIDTVHVARELTISPRGGVVLEVDREVPTQARIELRGAIETPRKH